MKLFLGISVLIGILHLVSAAKDMDLLDDDEDDFTINLKAVEDKCPGRNESLSEGHCNFDSNIHCLVDDQCKIGSKCCLSPEGCPQCVDVQDGKISRPKVAAQSAKKQRRKRQSFGCVACACVRACRTNADCLKNRRKRRCYKNSCSSYCVV